MFVFAARVASTVRVCGASHGSSRVMTKSTHFCRLSEVYSALVTVPQMFTVIVPGVLVLPRYSVWPALILTSSELGSKRSVLHAGLVSLPLNGSFSGEVTESQAYVNAQSLGSTVNGVTAPVASEPEKE